MLARINDVQVMYKDAYQFVADRDGVIMFGEFRMM